MAAVAMLFTLDPDAGTWVLADLTLDWTSPPGDEPTVTVVAATDTGAHLVADADADDLRFLLGHRPYSGAHAGYSSRIAMLLELAEVAPDVEDLVEVLTCALDDAPRGRTAHDEARALWEARAGEESARLDALAAVDFPAYMLALQAFTQEAEIFD